MADTKTILYSSIAPGDEIKEQCYICLLVDHQEERVPCNICTDQNATPNGTPKVLETEAESVLFALKREEFQIVSR